MENLESKSTILDMENSSGWAVWICSHVLTGTLSHGPEATHVKEGREPTSAGQRCSYASVTRHEALGWQGRALPEACVAKT